MDKKLQFIDAMIPKNSITSKETLFVLGGVINNSDEAVTTRAGLWAKATGEWKCLLSETVEVGAKEHKHLYYNIPSECFRAEYWDTQEIEELEIFISSDRPDAATRGVLVFVTGA